MENAAAYEAVSYEGSSPLLGANMNCNKCEIGRCFLL